MIESWTPATAAVAFLLYAASLVRRNRSTPDKQGPAIRLEALAWLVLLFHVLIAFGEYHHWSLAAAEEHVANRTEATVGLRWGWAIYLNYATLALWPIAILQRRRRLAEGIARPALGEQAIDVFVLFLWFNATIPFGSTAARLLGGLGFGVVAATWWCARRSRTTKQAEIAAQG